MRQSHTHTTRHRGKAIAQFAERCPGRPSRRDLRRPFITSRLFGVHGPLRARADAPRYAQRFAPDRDRLVAGHSTRGTLTARPLAGLPAASGWRQARSSSRRRPYRSLISPPPPACRLRTPACVPCSPRLAHSPYRAPTLSPARFLDGHGGPGLDHAALPSWHFGKEARG